MTTIKSLQKTFGEQVAILAVNLREAVRRGPEVLAARPGMDGAAVEIEIGVGVGIGLGFHVRWIERPRAPTRPSEPVVEARRRWQEEVLRDLSGNPDLILPDN
jgi:hypothetical protein